MYGVPRRGPARGSSRSAISWLALIYLGLILYASLYPFGPWGLPPSFAGEWPMSLPWPHYWPHYDIWINITGYLPMGVLAFAAVMRSGGRQRLAWLLGSVGLSALSYLMECLQYFVPHRVPSMSDWIFNSLGALAGTALGWALYRSGMLERGQGWRERWFAPKSAGALALLALWPVGLLFPLPAVLGVGQWLPRLQELSVAALDGTPWALQSDDADSPLPLPPGQEALAIALGLLGPTLLALAIAQSSRPGRGHRVMLVLGTLAAGLLVTTLSTALNFGPEHAWAWITPATLPGLGVGLLLGLLACLLPPRVAAACGLIALCALIALVSGAPTDPYLAVSLQTWEAGRFIDLYGLAQWVGWTWPFAAIGWLLWRVGQREA